MKKAKSLMLLTATILILAVMFCMNASAAEWTTIYGNAAYTLDEETGVMVIKGEGRLSSYYFGDVCYDHYDPEDSNFGCYCQRTEEYEPPEDWPGYEASQNTKTLIIQQGITSVDVRGFCMFENLEVVILPESVTEIPAGAFSGLKKLNTVVLSGSTTSIDQVAFSGCSNLRNMYIPDTVKTIHASAFSRCDMSSIRIPESVEMVPTNVGKVTVKNYSSSIKLTWTGSAGADGYRIFYKSGGKWKITVDSTTDISHTFKNLKAGAKYTFAIQPYVKTKNGVIWGEHAEVTASTTPATPTVKVTAPSKGKVTVNWNAVNGAEGYQLWYKKGNGGYKLHKTYKEAGTFTFSNLKSGTKYTFAVRAVIKTSAGNVRSGYKEAAVTVK